MNEEIAGKIDALLEKYAAYGRAAELARIREAAELAASAHEGQFRQSGEPYVCHPIAVAEIVTDIELDADSVIAGAAATTVEDTAITDA